MKAAITLPSYLKEAIVCTLMIHYQNQSFLKTLFVYF